MLTGFFSESGSSRESRERRKETDLDERVERVLSEIEERERLEREFDERIKIARKKLEQYIKELRDKELEEDSAEVREELHDRFVEDFQEQTQEDSEAITDEHEESPDEGEENESSGTATESSEQYNDTGGGIVYVVKMEGGGEISSLSSESEGISEVEESDESVEVPGPEAERTEVSTLEESGEISESEPTKEVAGTREKTATPSEQGEHDDSEKPISQAGGVGLRRKEMEQSRATEFEDEQNDESYDYRLDTKDVVEGETEKPLHAPSPEEHKQAQETESNGSEESVTCEDRAQDTAEESKTVDGAESFHEAHDESDSVERVDISKTDSAPEQDQESEVEALEERSEFADMEWGNAYPDLEWKSGFESMEMGGLFPREKKSERERLNEIWDKLSKEEKARIRPLLRKDIGSEEELKNLVRKFLRELTKSPDFRTDLVDSLVYVRRPAEERVRNAPPRLIRKLQNLIAELRWRSILQMLFNAVSMRSTRSLESRTKDDRENTDRESEDLSMETLEDFERVLGRHPYLRDSKSFPKDYRRIKEYYWIIALIESNPVHTFAGLSRLTGIPPDTISNWLRKKTIPNLMKKVLKNEELRIKWKQSLPREARPHYINPSQVYAVLQPLKEKKNRTIHGVVKCIATLVRTIDPRMRVTCACLRPYNRKYGPRWFLEVVPLLRDSKDLIQTEVNSLLQSTPDSEYRFALIQDKLYIWKRKTSPHGFLNLFNSELFYFERRFKRDLITSVRKHLDINGNRLLSRLIRQVTGSSKTHRATTKGINTDLDFRKQYVYGESLHFFLDTLGSGLHEIESHIKWIGERKQVVSPKILDDSEFLILMAKLFAAIGCDGHVTEQGKIEYHEKDPTRRERVKTLFSRLGVQVSMTEREGVEGYIRIRVANVIGRLLIKLGMTAGDKTILGVNLPDWLLNGSPEVQLAYISEVIPEDGYVYAEGKSTIQIGISRNVALYDISKIHRYGRIERISPKLVGFIHEHGIRTKTGFGGTCRMLTSGFLFRLKNHNDPDVASAAEELERIVYEHPSDYLEDEYALFDTRGFAVRGPYLQTVQLFERSGRVSSSWKIELSSHSDAAKLGILSPPNDERKRLILVGWMKRNPEVVRRALEQLRNGYPEMLDRPGTMIWRESHPSK
ncbi:MAG: hypothetical protein ACFE8Z_01650 [Candidatus Hermodarchaeota archaeon]